MKLSRRELRRLIIEAAQQPDRSPQFEKIKGFIDTAEDDSFLNTAESFIDSLSGVLPDEETLLLRISLALKSENYKDIPDLVFEIMGAEDNIWEPDDIGTDYLQRVMFKYTGGYTDTINHRL